MHPSRFVLRLLPGIAKLEALIEESGWEPLPGGPEDETIEAQLELVSKRLFGLTEVDTMYPPDEVGLSADERVKAQLKWDSNFRFLDDDHSDDEVQSFWSALGWDIADEHGQPLRCLSRLDRQIICATKGLKGKLPNQRTPVGPPAV